MADLSLSRAPRLSAFFSSCLARLWVPEWADVSSVYRLFLSGAPPHIAGFVVSLVVDAVKLVLRAGATAYRGEEVRKERLVAFVPLSDHRDAAPAVVLEILFSWIEAPLARVGPSEPLRRSMRLSVRSVMRRFLAKASARARSARADIIAGKKFSLAAIASAFPQFAIGKVGERGQPAKTLTRNIDEFWHPLRYHGITSMYMT